MNRKKQIILNFLLNDFNSEQKFLSIARQTGAIIDAGFNLIGNKYTLLVWPPGKGGSSNYKNHPVTLSFNSQEERESFLVKHRLSLGEQR